MRLVLSTVFILGLAATAASAQTAPTTPVTPTAPATTAAPVVTPPAPSVEEIVSCRYEKRTGSNFASRVCHTQKEWHQMNVDSRDTLEKMEDDGSRERNSGG